MMTEMHLFPYPGARPARIRRRGVTAAALILVCALFVAACGGSSSAAKSRPSTSAHLEIVTPAANETTPPNINLQFALQGAQVSAPTKLQITPNEGHIHVSIDGKLISMSYGLTQPVNSLAPGSHTLQAEFVANDHLPFATRVIAAVLFKVQG
jgi:hypothetical protein